MKTPPNGTPTPRSFGRKDDLRSLLGLAGVAGSMLAGGGLGYRGYANLAEEVHGMRAELAKLAGDEARGDVKRDEIRFLVDDLVKRVRELELAEAKRSR